MDFTDCFTCRTLQTICNKDLWHISRSYHT